MAAQWVQAFIQAIASAPPSLARGDYGIPCVSLQTITSLLKSSPNLLKAHLHALLPPVWAAFTQGLAVYEQVAVRGDEGAAGVVGEDATGIDGMAKAVLEFMQELAEKKSLKKMLEPHLENMVYYSIGCISFSFSLFSFFSPICLFFLFFKFYVFVFELFKDLLAPYIRGSRCDFPASFFYICFLFDTDR